MCKGKQLFNTASRFYTLMRESHNAFPEPCTTMEIVAVPQVFEKFENNKYLTLRVVFRAKFTEINQEKVRNIVLQIFNKKFVLLKGILLGESVGKFWWLHWLFPWNLTDAATTDYHRFVQQFQF